MFPSGTVFEWTAIVVAVVGLVSPFLPRISVEPGDLLAAVGAGAFFAVLGLLVRLLLGNLSLSDAVLLERGVGPFFGFLHLLGYWMLAWSVGASMGLLVRNWFTGRRPSVPH